MRFRTGGAWKEVSAARVRINGAWRQISEARAYLSGAWVTVATFVPSLSLSVPPNTSRTITGSGTATTFPVTATPTGGLSPYTYSWARVGAGFAVANSPASATTSFSRAIGVGQEATEQFRCTCTDAFGTSATGDILVTFTSTGFDEA